MWFILLFTMETNSASISPAYAEEALYGLFLLCQEKPLAMSSWDSLTLSLPAPPSLGKEGGTVIFPPTHTHTG